MKAHQQISFVDHAISSFIFIFLHIFPKSSVFRTLREKHTSLIIDKLKKNSFPKVTSIEIDRRDHLSEAEFIKKYLNQGIPVVFSQQAASWACTKKWSLDFLRTKYPQDDIALVEGAGLLKENRFPTEKEPAIVGRLKAKDFVNAIQRGEKKYSIGCPILETHPELLHDLDQTWLKTMRRCFLGVSYQAFLGAAGHTTTIHNEAVSSFFILADGEKQWSLYATSDYPLIRPEPSGLGYNYSKVDIKNPDPVAYCGFELLTRYHCHLKKGDILFVPAWMWHEVDNLSDSWGISYRFTNLRGFFRYPTFAFVRIFLAKPSLFSTLYYSFFRNDLGKRNESPLTPKLYLKD